MAAQNKNGPIIGLAIFVVLSIAFAVFWYMSHADNQQIRSQMLASQNDKQKAEGDTRDLLNKYNFMADRMGFGREQLTGHDESSAAEGINFQSNKKLADLAGDGTGAPANYNIALEKTANERNNYDFAATQRKTLFDEKQRELNDTIARKDEEIKLHRDAREKAEAELVRQETAHSEEMQRLEQQNDTLRKEKTAKEQEFADYRVQAERQIEDLNREVDEYRNAVVELRRQLRERQDHTFSKPDGLVTDVDYANNRCQINIGRADGLEVGVTFSVYSQANSGVGRKNTDDIKGSIEVIQVTGPHTAIASMVNQKDGHPIDTEDPIFSPVFQSGQALEIAILGRVSIDGLTRGELHRLIKASGSKVSIEVNDVGDFVDARGAVIDDVEEARAKISSRTRFVVIADLGDPDTKDSELIKLYERITNNSQELRQEAEKLGIYEVGLSTFLEYIGHSRKQVAWTPESSTGFPGRLTNGAKSRTVNGTMGNRVSSAVISGKYSGRRRRTTVSGGTTSKAYQN